MFARLALDEWKPFARTFLLTFWSHLKPKISKQMGEEKVKNCKYRSTDHMTGFGKKTIMEICT